MSIIFSKMCVGKREREREGGNDRQRHVLHHHQGAGVWRSRCGRCGLPRQWQRVYIRTCVCHWPLVLRLVVGGVCARVSGSHAIPSSLTAARTSVAAVDCFCANGLVVVGGLCGRGVKRDRRRPDRLRSSSSFLSHRVSAWVAYYSFHSLLHVN